MLQQYSKITIILIIDKKIIMIIIIIIIITTIIIVIKFSLFDSGFDSSLSGIS